MPNFSREEDLGAAPSSNRKQQSHVEKGSLGWEGERGWLIRCGLRGRENLIKECAGRHRVANRAQYNAYLRNCNIQEWGALSSSGVEGKGQPA